MITPDHISDQTVWHRVFMSESGMGRESVAPPLTPGSPAVQETLKPLDNDGDIAATPHIVKLKLSCQLLVK